jgi:hypothetical protein
VRHPSPRVNIGASCSLVGLPLAMSYPPPPGSEEPHYTPIYPAPPSNNTQQNLLDELPATQRLYQSDIYSKVENVLRQQAQHASHALSSDHGTGAHAQAHGAQQAQAGSPTDQQKANRLRKACDSCSIRKVKVGALHATWWSSTDPPYAVR